MTFPSVGLSLPEVRVLAARGDQLAVDAIFDDFALPQHHDPVEAGDCGEAMRDHDGSAPLHEVLQRSLDELLTFGVQRAGSFVQDQDGRICQNRARNRNSLPLSA